MTKTSPSRAAPQPDAGVAAVRCSAIVPHAGTVLLVQRSRGGATDWVLPGGTPRPGESLAACARREVMEETGIRVTADRVAFVLEAIAPGGGQATIDVVFLATGYRPGGGERPVSREAGLTPRFVPLDELAGLPLRPPVAGHIRGLLATPGRIGAAYLGNLWRPVTTKEAP